MKNTIQQSNNPLIQHPTRNGRQSKKSVGGDPVWPGAQGGVFVPVDCRFGDRLRLAENEIYRLSQHIRRQKRITLEADGGCHEKLRVKLADLRSPMMLDRQARELNLGLAPARSPCRFGGCQSLQPRRRRANPWRASWPRAGWRPLTQ